FEADQDRLTQVVVNLLANAIKFSPEGMEIVLAVKKQPESVRFEITDQGKGVPESMQAQIFERFKQVDRCDETQKGGTGLGLSICKAIVERHGGTIGVQSGSGRGSTFWFELPLEASKVAD
ncbi:MAG: sensor histidine kinase, partial [Terriglobales bacterium]